jgi:hypothetical protein
MGFKKRKQTRRLAPEDIPKCKTGFTVLSPLLYLLFISQISAQRDDVMPTTKCGKSEVNLQGIFTCVAL